jgi:hypothetical protein
MNLLHNIQNMLQFCIFMEWKGKCKSELLMVIHQGAQGMYEVGAIKDPGTMGGKPFIRGIRLTGAEYSPKSVQVKLLMNC